jgi:ribonuclease VapC
VIAVDTSALFVILAAEHERTIFVDAIAQTDRCVMSAATHVEIGIVISSRFGPAGQHYLSTFLTRAGVQTVPVDAEQADTAITAYRRFGKRTHPAGLNFGDCFSYALAKTLDIPLLYKGGDFAETDILSAV